MKIAPRPAGRFGRLHASHEEAKLFRFEAGLAWIPPALFEQNGVAGCADSRRFERRIRALTLSPLFTIPILNLAKVTPANTSYGPFHEFRPLTGFLNRTRFFDAAQGALLRPWQQSPRRKVRR